MFRVRILVDWKLIHYIEIKNYNIVEALIEIACFIIINIKTFDLATNREVDNLSEDRIVTFFHVTLKSFHHLP